MSTNQETELRREFDAARPPTNLTFSSESVLRQGNRTIRRRRIIAAGSTAMAVGLIAVGSTLLTRPHDSTAPPPADRTTSTGIVRAEISVSSLTAQLELNRDAKVKSNVTLFVVTQEGRRKAVGAWSIGEAGQKPDSTWKSGMVDGHPFTIGLVPGIDADIGFADGASYAVLSNEVPGTGYTMIAVQYKNGNEKEAVRPAQVVSISWSEPTGIVEGIEGDHRLTGRILAFDRSVSVKVVLRPGKDGRTTVAGVARLKDARGGYATPLAVATTDASGAAVVTGRYPTERRITKDGVRARYVGYDGAPIAAGVLPPGSSDIGVELTTNEAATGLAKSQRLPDGRVIFAVDANFGQSADPSKDSIKAVIWTNADGTQGRKAVTQKQP